MKKILYISICALLFAACSRRTVPSKSNNGNVIIENNSGNATNNNANNTGNVFANDSAASNTNSNTTAAFIVVSDGFGKVNDPGDSSVQYNQLELSKGFTSQQKLNLKTRYNTVPPRVLYVNKQNQQASERGSYYILAKKFWYWKKNDGLFYLDQKYYL